MASMNLNNNTNNLSKDIEQLSTGLRINSAADDPAGLVISENMSAQISGLTQATSNSNDASNMIKTAESALNQVQSLITSMRQLAVQASNTGVFDTTDLQADQTQISSALSSINNIAATTQFGNKKLLDGSATAAITTTAGSASLSAGGSLNLISQGTWNAANSYTYGTSTFAGSSAATNLNTITATAGSTALTTGAGTNALFSGNIAINGVTYNVSPGGGGVSLSNFNSAIASSGYTAAVGATGLTFTSNVTGQLATSQVFNLSGLSISTPAAGAVGAGAYAAGGAGSKATQTFATTGLTNNTPTLAQVHLSAGGTLTLNDQAAASATSVNVTYTAGESLASLNTAVQAATAGFTHGSDVVAIAANGNVTIAAGANGVDGAGAQANLAVFADNGGGTPILYADQTVQATGTFTNGANPTLTISDGNGHSMASQNTQLINGTYYYSFANGLVLSSTLSSGNGSGTLSTTAGASSTGNNLQFQIGANEGQTSTFGIQSMAASQLGQGTANYTDANGNSQTVLTNSLQDINVTTFKGAQDAIAVLDNALSQVSTVRAQLGAFQTNVLQSNIQSLGVANENLQASQSTIKDADLASTVVDYTKNNILVQAATSALTYANQMPQSVLKLLQ
jgi:flagellin